MQCDRERREQCKYYREWCALELLLLAIVEHLEDGTELQEKGYKLLERMTDEKGDDT